MRKFIALILGALVLSSCQHAKSKWEKDLPQETNKSLLEKITSRGEVEYGQASSGLGKPVPAPWLG